MALSENDVLQISLNDGVQIPQLGLGVWQVAQDDAERVVGEALRAGYRHVDTAQGYENEEGVGAGLRSSGLRRDEVFVTTKLHNDEHGHEAAITALEASLERLGLDQVDLYLIHWPQPRLDKYVETWEGLIEARERGLTRSIGVSNFHASHLERIIGATGVIPTVNQIELHPRLAQHQLVGTCRSLGVAVESWSPLASGQILSEPTLATIAETYGRSVAQVVIRWHLQLGYIVIPKSVTRERIAANIDVFDFELSDGDLAKISALNENRRTGWDPDATG